MEENSLHLAWVSTGSNIGEPLTQLSLAEEKLALDCGRICKRSAIYESEPWGFQSGHIFYNQCLCIETVLSPENLLKSFLRVEKELGRERKGNAYSDRLIDIDLLYYDDLCLDEEGIIIPHPRLQDRLFVLLPLSEIAPSLEDPRNGKTISELLASCPDRSMVQRTSS